MPNTELPFEPLNLNALRVKTQKSAKPMPLSWYETIAPRLPEEAKPQTHHAFASEEDFGPVRRLLFGDVEEIAEEERLRKQGSVPEPPEVTALKAYAADKARETIAWAKEDADAIRKQASEEGYEEGYAKGYAEGEREATRVLTQRADAERAAYREDLTALIAHIEAERQRAWEQIEPQAVGLVFDLAKQVIKKEIEATREVAISVIRNALRRVADSGTLRIRVHSDDLETVRANREDLLQLLDGTRNVEIVPDRRVGAGGCIIETEAGNIDARIETQLKEVGETLERTRTHREAA